MGAKSMFDLEKIYDAIFFAIRAHQGQKMKQPCDVDYSGHFFGVALTALNFIENENIDKDLVLEVALLHDVLEDTEVTFEELKNSFGDEVAQGVLVLTKDKILPKELQMEDCLKRILALNKKEYAVVKLADRCFNTRGKVDSWSKEKQQDYFNEAKLICDKIGFYCLPLKNKILENIKDNL